jgi:hypothetical protein
MSGQTSETGNMKQAQDCIVLVYSFALSQHYSERDWVRLPDLVVGLVSDFGFCRTRFAKTAQPQARLVYPLRLSRSLS